MIVQYVSKFGHQVPSITDEMKLRYFDALFLVAADTGQSIKYVMGANDFFDMIEASRLIVAEIVTSSGE